MEIIRDEVYFVKVNFVHYFKLDNWYNLTKVTHFLDYRFQLNLTINTTILCTLYMEYYLYNKSVRIL